MKSIAIHLPQFHPFPENDQWWGKGFTEWTNVAKAKPLFKNHYQPHLPADLGFYDLRLEETRIAQADLAKEYGINGFCHYHYWFNGKRLLNRPLDDMLATKTPDFPFMLCWANENWTRRWDGQDSEVLIKQEYTHEDDIDHIRFLCEHFFSDSRYIKVNGKPFFLIYRPGLFPNIKQTVETWRAEAMKMGIGELHIGYVQVFSYRVNPKEIGMDCAIEFHPDFNNVPTQEFGSISEKLKHKLNISPSPYATNGIFSYKDYVDKMISLPKAPEFVYPGITPGWDNSARRKKDARIFIDATPEAYEKWLTSIKTKYADDDTYLFINAWNEWAEGNHLEPCQKWGRSYLQSTRQVLKGA